MSYILEALKKAQAERQLGSAPTIHALPIHVAGEGRAGARPAAVRIAVAGVVLVLAAIAVVSWRQQAAAPALPVALIAAPAASPAAPVVTAAASPAAPVVAAAASPAAPGPVVAATPPAAPNPVAAETPLPAPAPMAAAAPPAAPLVSAAPAPQSAAVRPAPSRAAPPVVASKPAPNAGPASAPIAEDLPPTLRELPDAVQREVPQVAIGGYIYSKNPEDRLLLIDKVLRHEGEEVAPGLVLEKLLPKSAVMRFKGYRYRVPY